MGSSTVPTATHRIEPGTGRGPSASLALAAPLQVRGDERTEVAVEHSLHVARLVAGAFVLHELVRGQGVRADLAAEGDVALLSRHHLHRLAPLVSLARREAGREDLHRLR